MKGQRGRRKGVTMEGIVGASYERIVRAWVCLLVAAILALLFFYICVLNGGAIVALARRGEFFLSMVNACGAGGRTIRTFDPPLIVEICVFRGEWWVIPWFWSFSST